MKLQVTLCLNPVKVIDGFCYAFALALLQKLRQLNQDCLVYSAQTDNYGEVTDIAASVIGYLSQQVTFNMNELSGIIGGSRVTYKDLNGIIKHTEEFLAIFRVGE